MEQGNTNKVIVGYYLKDEAKKLKKCYSQKEAQTFMQSLYENKDCESYGIERNC